MTVTGVGTQFTNNKIDSKKSVKSDSFETFKNALSSWQEQIKDKIDKEKNSDGKSIGEMSDKQWKDLMKKVDSAIDTFHEVVKEESKAKEEQKQEPDKKNSAAVELKI